MEKYIITFKYSYYKEICCVFVYVKEGRKEGRKEERKEGRKEGRKKVVVRCLDISFWKIFMNFITLTEFLFNNLGILQHIKYFFIATFITRNQKKKLGNNNKLNDLK